MPKVNRKLTEKEIQNAKPKEKAYRLYDADGLTLLVRPTGTKVWQYRYKFNGKSNIYTFGQVGAILSAEVRSRFNKIKNLLEQGIDPNQHKKVKRQTNVEVGQNTFEILGREWYSKQTWKPKHAKNIMNRLEKDVFSNIGFKPIKQITIPDIISVLEGIEKRGALDVARRINQYCSEVFEYAIIKGLCDQNPAMGRTRILKPIKRKNRAHLQGNQLPTFINTLNSDKNFSVLNLAVELLLLTFVRPGELRNAHWDEIDMKTALWTIPAHRMKKDRDHIVPLSNQATVIIRKLHTVTGNGYLLFPGQKVGRPFSDVALIKVVKKLTNNQATPHGFRHTASTILHENNFPTQHIEMQLSHVESNKVRGAYNKAQYLEQRREIMQWWADYLDSLKSKK